MMLQWSLYDNQLQKTDLLITANEEVPDNYYHLVINIWILNSKNQLLIFKKTRNYNLHYPGFWTSINGNVYSEETREIAAGRIINKRIGINIDPKEMREVGFERRDPYKYIYNTYIIRKDINIEDLTLDDDKIVQAKWIDLKELYNMIENGEIAWVLIPRIEKYVIPEMKVN